MPSGLQVFNDSGFVQIDADYRNMEFRQKGSASIPATNAGSGGSISSGIYVAITGSKPVLAVKSSQFCACYLISVSGNTFNFYIYNGSNATNNVEWYAFDYPDAGSMGSSGFQVFDAQSRLVFDSNKRYMKVLDYWQSDLSTGAAQSRNYPGKTVAVMMGDYGYRYTVQNSPADPSNPNKAFVQSWLDCAQIVGASVTLQSQATYTNTFIDRTSEMQPKVESPSKWLVVDVTGY